MSKLSIIIPSRDEKFLTPTIDDIFRNVRGDTEVIAVLDSDKWPGDWKEVTARHPRLHTIHNGAPIGMRGSINKGVASAISRGAKFIAKFDAHCSFSEGFDEVLRADCDADWIVVPRRGRLDADNWTATDTHKSDIDYHYLSFPSNPDDWGGPGLNGRPWAERAIERKDILIDDEMSSQGSGWFMHADFFTRMGFMDEAHYGPFWNEFQELGMCAWLSGGAVKVNKKCRYLHLHKGSKHGRGYRLSESWLQQGRDHTMKWIFNEAWDHRQVRSFRWLIERFWPVPTWPEDWEEVLYATRKPRSLISGANITAGTDDGNDRSGDIFGGNAGASEMDGTGLVILSARYGVLGAPMPFTDHSIDVTDRVQSMVKNNSLDIVVDNSTLAPGQNPYRGKKKVLLLTYCIDDGEQVTVERVEKDWLIIGPASRDREDFKAALDAGYASASLLTDKSEAGRELVRDGVNSLAQQTSKKYQLPKREAGSDKKFCPYCGRLFDLRNGCFPIHASTVSAELREVNPATCKGSSGKYIQNPAYTHIDSKSGAYVPAEVASIDNAPRTAAALNDYLIRKFHISPQRLRGPMPIELRDFHRNDLAQLFAELGFKRGAEIGVAEGNYSEVLLKTNPECELLLVDPWHAYSDNPQNKSHEKHEFAYNEVIRKTMNYPHVEIRQAYSMDAVDGILYESLDFCYIDGNHLFDFVMQDLIEWSKRVRSGGIVSGDDYYALDQKRWVGGGVVEAVQAYVNAHRIPVWWIFQGHKSTDFMWIKP